MNEISLRCRITFLLVICASFWALPLHAVITCSSASMTAVDFGTVDPLSSQTPTTATLSYTCSNSAGATHSAMVCFSIGEPAGNQTNPRQMTSGTNKLNFQLYQNASYGSVWGSQFFGTFLTPMMVPLTLAGGKSTTGAASLYAQVPSGQTTALSGSYADNYGNVDTAVTINDVAGTAAPTSCGGTQITGLYFPFNVTAIVQKNCTVTTTDLDFGSVPSGTAPASGNSSLNITCSFNTPYNVGLAPQNISSTTGVGTMKGAIAGNTNTVTYQLYSNSGLTTVWGNTATATSVGNGLHGTGNGSVQPLTVYAKVTSTTDVQPDVYSDIVQVNVNY